MKMSKFYAIRVGREVGIFNDWPTCQRLTTGYPCATFKSFKSLNDAVQWLEIGKSPVSTIEGIKTESIEIYTDGSHQRAKGYLGIGAWASRLDESDAIREYELSLKCSPELLATYGISEDAECSNPTAEFVAFAEVLKRFVHLRTSIHLEFFCDYIGVQKWMSGEWKAKESHIRAILETCQKLRSQCKSKITIHWIPGHSGNAGNDHADKLAGSHDEIDSFKQLALDLDEAN